MAEDLESNNKTRGVICTYTRARSILDLRSRPTSTAPVPLSFTKSGSPRSLLHERFKSNFMRLYTDCTSSIFCIFGNCFFTDSQQPMYHTKILYPYYTPLVEFAAYKGCLSLMSSTSQFKLGRKDEDVQAHQEGCVGTAGYCTYSPPAYDFLSSCMWLPSFSNMKFL